MEETCWSAATPQLEEADAGRRVDQDAAREDPAQQDAVHQDLVQEIYLEVNVLTFVFSGTFSGDAFRDAGFHFSDLWIGAQIGAANEADIGAEADAVVLEVDQNSDIEINVLNFLFTGDVQERAFDGLAVYFDDVRTEVWVAETNDARIRALGIPHADGRPEYVSGSGQEIVQSADQEIRLAVNLLTFEFSGTFGDDAFRDADFHFSRIAADLWVDVRNTAGLMAAGDDTGGDVAQTLSQQEDATFGLLNARFDDTYEGDAFRDADIHVADIGVGVRLAATNDALLEVGGDRRIESAGGILPPDVTGVAPGDAWMELG